MGMEQQLHQLAQEQLSLRYYGGQQAGEVDYRGTMQLEPEQVQLEDQQGVFTLKVPARF